MMQIKTIYAYIISAFSHTHFKGNTRSFLPPPDIILPRYKCVVLIILSKFLNIFGE